MKLLKFQSNIYPFNINSISLKYHLISINFDDTHDIHLRSFKIPFLSNLNIQRGRFPSPSTPQSKRTRLVELHEGFPDFRALLVGQRPGLGKSVWRTGPGSQRVGSKKTKAQVEGQFLLFWDGTYSFFLGGKRGSIFCGFVLTVKGCLHHMPTDRTSWRRVPDHHRKACSAEGGGIAKVHQGIHLILQGHGTHGYPAANQDK